ncbi:MAG: PEP-utilizing enzyme [Patescibacteria group bacterium]|jgi:phosphoenolpyruvate synthase/pyruvate phosphate dikinase|nr:PEP-utilizing enzyme [Patescibacteria group bacterium]
MSKAVITKDQISITEWFAQIGELAESNAFRQEDNEKSKRLELLYQTIGLNYERPEIFEAADFVNLTPAVSDILTKRGQELCAFRLVPKRDSLPKLRNRGLNIKDCYQDWFLKQDINPADYFVHLCPHSETLLFSSIFLVKPDLIFGEIIAGLHSQLTHGDTESTLYQFRYDFKDWWWPNPNTEVEAWVKQMIAMLRVTDQNKQAELKQGLGAEFFHDYLAGYFEATIWPDKKIRFVDFNRILPKYIPNPKSSDSELVGYLKGVSANPGIAQGPVIVVGPKEVGSVDFKLGAILVCDNTDVRYLPYMRQAAAIITNRGGILTHAAIISRELGKPCIVDTKNATMILQTGDLVEVDATAGVVRKLNK